MTLDAIQLPTETWIGGAAGPLFVRHWAPVKTPVASLVICHGLNAHSGHYARAAEVFAQRGIAVTALDLRGRGRSEGDRYYVETIDDYVDDVSLAVNYAQERAGDRPLFLLGHSAGGVVAVSYALRSQAKLRGLIIESWAYQLPAPEFALKVLRGASHFVPHLPVLRLKPQDFSRDPAWVAALAEDPFVDDEVQPIETVAALARADERLGGQLGKLTMPLLILHGTADRAANSTGSEALLAAAGSIDKALKLYDGHYHDLLNDLDRDRVTNDIGNWITNRP